MTRPTGLGGGAVGWALPGRDNKITIQVKTSYELFWREQKGQKIVGFIFRQKITRAHR